MHQPGPIQTDRSHERLGAAAVGGLTAIVVIGYSITFAVADQLTPRDALLGGLANSVPTMVFGALAWRFIRTMIVGRRPVVQLAGHAATATVFSLLAFWLTAVLLGLVNGVSPTQFTVEPFIRRAMAWQLLENYTTYGVIAALAYVRRPEPVNVILPSAGENEDRSGKAAGRYFIRSGEEFRPVEIDRIVSITGADDYAELATTDGRHLARMTLAQFERSLDPERFVRVHRSCIVNLEHLERAEPAGGGRMLLYMDDGEIISASRAGARLLRDRVL